MRRIGTNKTFLWIVQCAILTVIAIGWINIGGWMLVLGAWLLLVLFALFHLIIHLTYLFLIERIEKDHLRFVHYSNLSFLLFFLFHYDMGDSTFRIMLVHFIKTINENAGLWLYELLEGKEKYLVLITFLNFLFAEILFIVKLKRFRRAEKLLTRQPQ